MSRGNLLDVPGCFHSKITVWKEDQFTRDKTEEDVHIRPGHHWVGEFGDAGNVSSCEKQFNLSHHT